MQVQAKTITYNEPTTIMPNNFSGWIATNIGTANGQVMGHVLTPGQQFNMATIDPHVTWNSPIAVIAGSGAIIVITLLQYS